MAKVLNCFLDHLIEKFNSLGLSFLKNWLKKHIVIYVSNCPAKFTLTPSTTFRIYKCVLYW